MTASHILLNVSVPAIDGRANIATTELIAKSLKVAKTDVHVVKGERGRDKVVEVKMRGGDKDEERGEGVLDRVRRMLEDAVIRKDTK